LNQKLKDVLPHVVTHPIYNPHATIAYVKPEYASRFDQKQTVITRSSTVLTHAIVSMPGHEKIVVPLRQDYRENRDSVSVPSLALVERQQAIITKDRLESSISAATEQAIKNIESRAEILCDTVQSKLFEIGSLAPAGLKGWVTIEDSGTRIYVDDSGTVTAGPPALEGRRAGDWDGPKPSGGNSKPSSKPDSKPESKPSDKPTSNPKPEDNPNIQTDAEQSGSAGEKPENQTDQGSNKPSSSGKKPSKAAVNAVRDYTEDHFQEVNGALRSGKVDPAQQKIINGVDEFLDKSPKRPGSTLRSFTIDDSEVERYASMLEPGKEFSDPAYMSTRKNPTLEDRLGFGQQLAPKGQVILRVNGKSGVDITNISLNPGEGEVLYPRGTKFVVESMKRTPAGGILAIITEK
jgi:hypothetical protein